MWIAGFSLIPSIGLSQGATCAEMEPICTDDGAFFTATVGSFSEPGNDYGCLFTTPDPSWYYFEIATAGDIDMELSAAEDIDFIIWGPFADLATAISYCGLMGVAPEAPEVDCSYSASAIEFPVIPSCIPGEVYVMLITNYAGIVQDVSLTQIGGTGSTDCSIVVPDPCESIPGTYAILKNGVPTSSPVYLCQDDELEVISNDDYTLPIDVIAEPIGDGVWTADILWLVYDTPPISALTDPTTDPGYLDYIFAGEDFSDINDAASAIVAALGCGTYYFVPVAGDDGIGLNGGVVGTNDNGELHWDQDGNGCWLLGTPIEVTYSCEIVGVITTHCDPPTVINGVDIDLSGGSGNFDVVNTGDGDLSAGLVSNPGTALVENMENGDDWEIEVTDDMGCTATFSGTFDAPVLNPVVVTNAASCPGGSFGNVDATILAGSGNGGPYTLTLNGIPTAGTNADLDGTAGTVVTIIAIDGEGCISDSVVTIGSAGHFIDIDVIEIIGVSCNGSDDGSVTISADPTPTGSVTDIVWTSPTGTPFAGGAGFTTKTDMEAGSWEVCVTDDVGCEVCIVVNVPNVAALDIYVQNSNIPTCWGFTDGSITVASNGGTPSYTYTWDPTNPISGGTFNNLGAGMYMAYVEDANGCIDSIAILLTEPEQLDVELTIYNVACYGDATGIAVVDSVLNAQGDYDNVSFFWNPNPSGVSGDKADSAFAMGAGTYTLTINDDYGCTYVVDVIITQPEPLVFTEIGFEPAYCRLFPYQSGNGIVFAAAAGGTGDFDYVWKDSLTGETVPNTTWGGLNSGWYIITVTDDNGCILTQNIYVDSLNPIAEFDMTSPQFESEWAGTAVMDIHFINQSLYFANPNDPLADTTFFWNFDDQAGWIITHDYYETYDRSYTESGTYEICLVAQNKNGCTDTTCKELIVYDPIKFEPVNVFTPNGDGVNDVFTFDYHALSINTFSCLIVDRWGNKKYEMTSLTDGWNGHDKSGSMCRDGVYFYTWQAVSDNGTQLQGQGNVQLLSAPAK